MREASPDPDTKSPQGSAVDLQPSRAPADHSLLADLGEAAEMIAFKHSVFALPFALMSLITAAGDDWPAAATWVWVIIAMISARTAAMSFNRLADHGLDAINPRTANRSLPAGRLSRRFALSITVIAALAFVGAAAMLNRLCLVLAIPTLAILLGYSFAKRWTAAVHLWLGFSLGIAPIGAWIAVTGTIAVPPVILGAAVMLWVAGFDTVYSLQDEAFDRSHGLRSIPATFGPRASLWIARFFHLFALVGFTAFAVAAGGGWLRFAAVAAAAILMGWQHRLIRADDLSAVDAAFFTANGLLSVVMCSLFVIAKMAA
jgi:4-hydroxybenzoate polyprenyltransferase